MQALLVLWVQELEEGLSGPLVHVVLAPVALVGLVLAAWIVVMVEPAALKAATLRAWDSLAQEKVGVASDRVIEVIEATVGAHLNATPSFAQGASPTYLDHNECKIVLDLN